jgi:hypothetical protein
MPDLTQDEAMEAALLAGTLPEEDRRAPDVVESDLTPVVVPHVPVGAPLFQGVPGDVAASLVHFDQNLQTALEGTTQPTHTVVALAVLAHAVYLVKRAKEETGYAQTGVLDALINLLTRHQPQ